MQVLAHVVERGRYADERFVGTNGLLAVVADHRSLVRVIEAPRESSARSGVVGFLSLAPLAPQRICPVTSACPLWIFRPMKALPLVVANPTATLAHWQRTAREIIPDEFMSPLTVRLVSGL